MIDPKNIHVRLSKAARRLRRLRALRYNLFGIAIALALLSLLLMADTWLHFGVVARWTAFSLVLAPVLAGLVLAIRAALPRISQAGIARRIESAAPGSGNTLISAVQFDKELPADSAFREALFDEMNDPFPLVNWKAVFDFTLFKRLGIGLGVVLLLLGAFAFRQPLYFRNSVTRILLPASNIAPLTRTQILSVTPGSIRVINGRDLTVVTQIGGHIPKGVWLETRAVGGRWEKQLMNRDVGSDTFTFDLKEIRQPFRYRVIAGDAASSDENISVRARTAIIRRVAEIQPPAYTKLPVETREGFTDLQNVLPGSRITLTVEFNAPLKSLSAPEGMTAEKLGDTTWKITGTVTDNASLKLDFVDNDELNDQEIIAIVTVPDAPPTITVTVPQEGKQILAASGDTLPVTFTATDNIALGSVAIYRSTADNPEAEQIKAWDEAVDQQTFTDTIQIPLDQYTTDNQVTFVVVARDQNDASGPGITRSRPVTVTLRTEDQVKDQKTAAIKKAIGDIDGLIRLQAVNIEASQNAQTALGRPQGNPALPALLETQSKIAEIAAQLILSGGDVVTPEIRASLTTLNTREIPGAVSNLRVAVAADNNERKLAALGQAIPMQVAILAKLQGVLQTAKAEDAKRQIQDIVSRLEELLKQQTELREITTRTPASSDGGPLSTRQDALAERGTVARKNLEKSALDASIGTQEFRDRLAEAAKLFGTMRIYEGMLDAADKLSSKAFPDAAVTQKDVIVNLAKLVEKLNDWQVSAAEQKKEELKEAAHAMTEKLKKLAELQKEIVEKSKEMGRRDDTLPEDAAVSAEIIDSKKQIADVIEKMLTDAHIFPDVKTANELRDELIAIFEEVKQVDLEEQTKGGQKANEIPVQKEEGVLSNIEGAKKVSEDLEIFLDDHVSMARTKMENFDETERPDMPMLPLPDMFEDIIGDLLKVQDEIEDEAKEAASNQAMAEGLQGWQIDDGPMSGYSAQGFSGNTPPRDTEQEGRSSGGRQGKSNGEMAGSEASNLEGAKTEARRTNEAMQGGSIQANDTSNMDSLATGGGKSGGVSDRMGMDGNAPLRETKAPLKEVTDALAVKQALLAEKTAKAYSQATLMYLRANGLSEASRLMDEGQVALKEGRLKDFGDIHAKVVTQLNKAKGGIQQNKVLTIDSSDTAQVQEQAGFIGDEGQAPDQYKKAVADYYRSLQP